jgi:hypothetical protein
MNGGFCGTDLFVLKSPKVMVDKVPISSPWAASRGAVMRFRPSRNVGLGLTNHELSHKIALSSCNMFLWKTIACKGSGTGSVVARHVVEIDYPAGSIFPGSMEVSWVW